MITVGQLLQIGLSRSAIDWRIRTGKLFPIHRGVFAVGHPKLTRHGEWRAATLALGPRAILSHRSAAELWELLPHSAKHPEVTLPYPASPAKRAKLIVYRSRTLARTRTTMQAGIPVTMPARTLADLARVATPAELRRATRAAETRGLPLDPDHISDKTESDLERDFAGICDRYGIPRPETQVRIGRYRVDFLWREQGLVVETDGYVYHRGRQAMRDDNDRDIELELLGLRVIRIEDSRIADDPAGIAAAVLVLLDR